MCACFASRVYHVNANLLSEFTVVIVLASAVTSFVEILIIWIINPFWWYCSARTLDGMDPPSRRIVWPERMHWNFRFPNVLSIAYSRRNCSVGSVGWLAVSMNTGVLVWSSDLVQHFPWQGNVATMLGLFLNHETFLVSVCLCWFQLPNVLLHARVLYFALSEPRNSGT
jgi:hypothetical protein